MATTDTLADLVARVPDLDTGGGKKKGRETGKLTGPPWPEAIRDIFDPVLAGGRDAIVGLVGMLTEVDDGRDYKARYTLHGLCVYVCRKGKEKERAVVIDALGAQLGGSCPTPIQEVIVWELETVGDERAVPALAPLLNDPTVGPDAVRTLVAIRDGAAEPIRKALAQAKGPMRLHLVQAAGQLGDKQAVPHLRKAATAADADLRITARWALATLGDAWAADLCLKGARASGWERIKAVKACLLLAETLAAARDKRAATDVYTRLREACGADRDAYVRDACDRGLMELG